MLTGEHGVGVEKRDLMPVMFSEIDLAQQQRLKCAFDPTGPAQSRQGVSAAASLRRARAACMSIGGKLPLPRPAAVLMAARDSTPRDDGGARRRRAEASRREPLELIGGGSKRGLGRPLQRGTCSTCAFSGIRDLRAGGAGADRRRGDAARRDRGGARRRASDAGLRAAAIWRRCSAGPQGRRPWAA